MTTDLDRLIEAVEAGPQESPPWRTVFGWDETLLCENAYRGSLDAAVSLLEALLPGWHWSLDTGGGMDVPHAAVFPGPPTPISASYAEGETPARALLLATLRAYRSTREGEA